MPGDDRDDDPTTAGGLTSMDSFVRKAARAPAVGGDDAAGTAAPSLELALVDFDRYVDRREIARGGMGRVVAARDHRLQRTVAIKELHSPSPSLRARFERETLITARLQHPSIVSILEAGRWPTGEPFYAMRLIPGQPFSRLVEAATTLDARLALLPHVLAVADALAYAHQERVIHRDLKPQNVMVGAFGETVLIDWGLAKELDAPTGDGAAPVATDPPVDDDDEPDLTVEGTIMGTPMYMAPEQARGEPVDERADVYALGALLYYLLGGVPPYDGVSNVVRAVAAGPPAALASVAPGTPRELIAIVTRAMAREAGQRYRAADGFAADLRAFLTGQLVGAHHYRTSEKLRRWLRRHRNAAVVATVLVAALAITAGIGIRGIARERDRATGALAALQLRDSELALRQAESLLATDPTAAIAWIKQALPASAEVWRARALAEIAVSRGVAHQVVTLDGAGLVLTADGERAVLADRGGGVWSWDGATMARIGHGLVDPVALAARGGRAVLGDQAGNLHAIDLATGGVELVVRGASMRGAAIAPSGDVWSVDLAGVVRRSRAGVTTEIARIDGAPSAFALMGEGGWALGLGDGGVVLADPTGGPPRRMQVHTREVGEIVFVDEHTLISIGEDGLVVAWDPATGGHRELGRHDEWVSALAISPDRRLVATGSADGTIRIWPLDGAAPRVLRGHSGTIWTLAWGPDGRLASGAGDAMIRVWSPRFAATAIPVGQSVRRLGWAHDGGLVALVADTARVYAAVPSPPVLLPAGLDRILAVAGSPGGRRVAAGGRDRRALIWDLETETRLVEQPLAGWITNLSFADDDHVIVASETEAVALDLTAPAARAPVVTDLGTLLPRPFADGTRVAWIDALTGGALIADLRTGAIRTVGVGSFAALAVAPDDRSIVTGGHDGTVTLWPLGDGAPRVLGQLAGRVELVGFAPDQRGVAAIARTGPGWVWPLPGGAGQPISAVANATSFELTRTGQIVAGVGRDVVIVDLATGVVRRLAGHRADVGLIVTSPDGQRVVSIDLAAEVRIWRIRDGASAVIAGEFVRRCQVDFVGNDHLVLSTGGGDVVVVGMPAELAVHDDLAAWLDATTTAVVGPDLTPRSP